MFHVQKLRVFASQRLNEALEEILEAFEKTIVKYEEEAALNREVISRQHALLCALNNPVITDTPAEGIFTQQLFNKDVPTNHQNLSQDLVSEASHVEQKQQGEQDLDEVEIIEFTYNSKNSKRPRHSFQTLAELGSVAQSQNGSIESSTETEDSDDYSKDFTKPASDNPEGLCKPKDGFSCLSCSRTYTARRFLFRHVRVHIQDARKVCGLCGEQFETADDLKSHLQTHSRTRKNQIQVRTRSREVRLQHLSEVNQNRITEKTDDSSKTPEVKKKLRGRPRKNKSGKDDPAENKKRKKKT